MTAAELEELAELGLAYLPRFAAARLIRWWLPRPGTGGTGGALAVGMLRGRLQSVFTPSPKLMQQNLLARERLLAEMLGPDQGDLEQLLGDDEAASYPQSTRLDGGGAKGDVHGR